MRLTHRAGVRYYNNNMIKNTSIVDITIYKLDIYRLLTLLLADKQIVKNSIFKNLGNDNFDNEVNRLLILISAITRQLLDNTNNKLKNNECGVFWHNYPTEMTSKKLKFKQACSMVVHATDVTVRTPTISDYFYSENGKEVNVSKQEPELYFQDKIIVIGQKHERADIDLQQFVQHCIQLSNEIITGE